MHFSPKTKSDRADTTKNKKPDIPMILMIKL